MSGESASTSLKCSICMSSFKDPRFLNCHHTFCLGCLEPVLIKWASKKEFPCPLCRQTTEIPKNGAKGLQCNFYIPDVSKKTATKHKQECDLCDRGDNPIYKCIRCQVMLCESCKESHLKIKTKKGHDLVNIRYQNCEIHKSFKVSLYCTFCKQKLCTKCCEELHSGHDVEYLSVAAERERLKMREVSLNVRSYLLSFDKTAKEVKKEFQRTREDLSQIHERAHKHGQELKQGIDNALSSLDKYLNQQNKTNKRNLLEFHRNLATKKDAIVNILATVNESLEKDNDLEILQKCRPIYRQLLTTSHGRLELPRREYHFFPSEIHFGERSSVGAIIGSDLPDLAVEVPPSILYSPVFEIKLVSKFKSITLEKAITAIAPISGNLAWICYNHGSIIYLFTTDGLLKKQIPLPNSVGDITVNDDGGLLISSYSRNIIWRVEKTYSGIVSENTFEYQPKAICWTTSGTFCIFSKAVSLFRNQRIHKIGLYNFEMKLIQELQKSEDNEDAPFRSPHRIAQQANGDLVVLDNNDSEEGILLTISTSLKFKSKAHCKAKEGAFKPGNICCDAYGNTFVAIPDKHAVLVQTASETNFQPFLSGQHGIVSPCCLAVDGEDHLWVGDSESGEIHIFKYMK